MNLQSPSKAINDCQNPLLEPISFYSSIEEAKQYYENAYLRITKKKTEKKYLYSNIADNKNDFSSEIRYTLYVYTITKPLKNNNISEAINEVISEQDKIFQEIFEKAKDCKQLAPNASLLKSELREVTDTKP